MLSYPSDFWLHINLIYEPRGLGKSETTISSAGEVKEKWSATCVSVKEASSRISAPCVMSLWAYT